MAEPKVLRTISAIRDLVATWKQGGRVALVPTMGALHEGHVALVRAARERAPRVVVSIFVNPAQFAPTEDFASYPRNEASDLGRLSGGADVVFAPGVEEMYPAGFDTSVTVGGPAEGLETTFRPHFFRGVATVVSKLFLATGADVALFGEKDYQQLAVIRQMVADLAIPVEVVGVPTIREPDGLALSSRNAYLSADERNIAPQLHSTLAATAARLRSGKPPQDVLDQARRYLNALGFRVDYLDVRNAATLAPVETLADQPARLLVAAWLGRTRLIDNLAV